jgi:hypothetical protein
MRIWPRGSVVILCLLIAQNAQTQEASPKTPAGAVLWTDPGDIRARNLYWGAGGEEHQPKLPVEFVKEDTGGTNPKFDVRDSADHKWKAKLGLEAKPETAASRLLWAVGYTSNENYLFHELQVENLPPTLHRGQQLVGKGGSVSDVRLQRPPHGFKKSGDWNWRHNPFYGTREFNGLRIMMALIANWDLKDDNNAILENEKEPAPKIYEVTDVGTAFGTVGKSYTNKLSKKNLPAYQRARLISHVHSDYVDLNFPKRPPIAELFEFQWIFFFHQVHMRWVGKHIPRADAKWIGSLLAQLTPDQIHDAFRAAGYSPEEIDAYSQAVLARIKELNDL